MNLNVSFDHNIGNQPLSDKLCKKFSDRGLSAVRGYTPEAIGCKSADEVVRDMRAHVAQSVPGAYPAIKNAAKIAARKQDEERVARLSAETAKKTSVIKRMVGIEKKPGEYSKKEIIKKADTLLNGEKRVHPARFPVSAVVTVLLCSVMAMFMVFAGAMVKGVSDDIDSLRGESSDLLEKQRELTLAIEEKNDLRVIERIAVEELGMIKKDFITKNYITMGTEDKVEVFGGDTADTGDASSTLLSAIGEQFGRFMEYID